MKVKFYHWYNAVLAALLSMLGFSGCNEIGADEYGCPWSEYQIKGTVSDETGQPISDIQVELAEHAEEVDVNGKKHVYHRAIDTLYTDAQGKYQTPVLKEGGMFSEWKVIVEDIDGPANGGEFQSDTLAVPSLERKQVKKGEGWYTGKYEFNGDITLKRKTEN